MCQHVPTCANEIKWAPVTWQILSTALDRFSVKHLDRARQLAWPKSNGAETAKSSTRNTIIEKSRAPTSTENTSHNKKCEVRESLKAPGVRDEMGRRDWATAKLLVNQAAKGGGGYERYNYEVSCDWRFRPPNTLLKQEGLQLVASFRDKVHWGLTMSSSQYFQATTMHLNQSQAPLFLLRYGCTQRPGIESFQWLKPKRYGCQLQYSTKISSLTDPLKSRRARYWRCESMNVLSIQYRLEFSNYIL